MLKRMTFNKQELQVLIDGLKKQKKYEPNTLYSDLKTVDELLGLLEKMKNEYKPEKPFDVSPRVKKAREEYDKIFFERYGVKK
jgi:ribonuclease HI|tara:strand:+ start:1293 stop:1541 length:249 start_codon:yes stop_codon:yes gene_type:complete